MNAGSVAAPVRTRTRVAIAVGAVLAALLVVGIGLVASLAGMTDAPLEAGEAGDGGADARPSALARAEIPPQYLRLYQLAAERYGIDWAILAGDRQGRV